MDLCLLTVAAHLDFLWSHGFGQILSFGSTLVSEKGLSVLLVDGDCCEIHNWLGTLWGAVVRF